MRSPIPAIDRSVAAESPLIFRLSPLKDISIMPACGRKLLAKITRQAGATVSRYDIWGRDTAHDRYAVDINVRQSRRIYRCLSIGQSLRSGGFSYPRSNNSSRPSSWLYGEFLALIQCVTVFPPMALPRGTPH